MMYDFDAVIESLNGETPECSFASQKRTYRVDEIQDILGIGRDAAYSLCKSGKFHTVKIGKSLRISKKSFDNWLDGLK